MSDSRQAAFARECDLIMKGGITSGIVYPLAITEIAKAFRLRSIGGTSAGAIAAAAAAAAELGRQRYQQGELSSDPAGFATIERLPQHLCVPAANGHGTKLLALFKPAPAVRALFDTFIAILEVKGKSPWTRLFAPLKVMLMRHKLAALVGALLAGGPLWWSAASSASVLVWLWVLLFAALGGVLAVIVRLALVALRELPASGFGLCSGMPEADDDAPDEALTTWLTQYFDQLSGQREYCANQANAIECERPLTFGDLRRHGIDLQVMTTCLSMARPFRLPFRDDEQVRDNNQFHFRQEEFARLFPHRVVAWMGAHQRPGDDRGDGYLRLPLPDDLPVIVAVRMSLSFPLLLSAVPLHAVDYRKSGKKLERCWFTDGGISSNFPIHFFDAALPRRPTFGLDLGPTDGTDEQRVRFPRNNGDARLAYWRRFPQTGLPALRGFLALLSNVAKDWNHETLSLMPGFRDRIGLIQLTREEGGLNLTMPTERIERLTRYGREAGQQFVLRFGDPQHWQPGAQASPMNWENHQIIRLRLQLASVAEQLQSLERACRELHSTEQDYQRFFSSDAKHYSYPFKGLHDLEQDPDTGLYRTQAGMAQAMLSKLREIAQMIEQHPDSHPAIGAPKPTPELKLRPRL
ncbi:patatin-like phospholipase family protein [Ectopseudomonas chengduensis]